MHRPFKALRWCLVLFTASGAGRGAPRPETMPFATRGWQSIDTCPPDADSRASPAPTDVVRIGEHSLQGVRYVTILVDGQRAAWNEPTSTSGSSLGPDIDPNDIEHVELLKGDSARRAYGTCPGVALLLITTKSKTWHPHPRYGVSPSSTNSAEARTPSMDSVAAMITAYVKKRVSAAAGAKVIVDYLVGAAKPLNLQMDAELRDAVNREKKARGLY